MASAAPPQVTGTWAAEITATSARFKGLVDTANQLTSYRFDYITLSAYEANLAAAQDPFKGALKVPTGFEAKLIASATEQEAVQRVAGLVADTSYRYRLVVKNPSGEQIGPERTITTQEASPSFSLPEGRGWEMVSPIDKNGGEIATPETLFGGGDFQAAAQGGSVTYGSASSFAGAAGAPGASQYLSTRSGGGWSTQNLTLATKAGAFGTNPDGAPYRLFSTDLSTALALSEPHAFQLLAVGSLTSLHSLAASDLSFAGATKDLSQIVFSTGENLYERSGGTSVAINIEPGDSSPTPGASLAAQGGGAISTGGQRIYWVDKDARLLVRDGERSLLVDPEGEFQAASSDGQVAYFTKAAHLYRYSLATESASDLTPGGAVLGVLGASADASSVYYLDATGVKLFHEGTTIPVAADAAPSSYPPATGTARVSADGRHLAFLSSESLTGYESLGTQELYLYSASAPGPGSLLCASCNPTGARPVGLSTVPGAISNGSEVKTYKPRVMDTQGSRLFFDSQDALSAKDSNAEPDVYEWRAQGVGGCAKAAGCVALISSGRGAEPSRFIDASADGADVFFLAPDSLVSSDPGSLDLYDARIGGGFPEPTPPIPCFGDACQPLPPEPEDPTPGTLFIGSEANPALHFEGTEAKQGKKGKGHKGKGHHKKHHHKKGKAKR
jgi:hypothetical protein